MLLGGTGRRLLEIPDDGEVTGRVGMVTEGAMERSCSGEAQPLADPPWGNTVTRNPIGITAQAQSAGTGQTA
jgi:hypothetical protein